MKLYHYSLEQLDVLKSLNAQDPQPLVGDWYDYIADGKNPPYHSSISLFIEPLPYETIAAIFGFKHPFYVPNGIIYEHVIDSEQWKDMAIRYRLVETPKIVRMINLFDFDLGKDKVEKYKKTLNRLEVRSNLGGDDYYTMLKKIKPFLGCTEGYFHHARRSVWCESSANKYAAGVPHLMVYPLTQEVEIESVKRIQLGSSTLKEQLYHLSFNDKLPSPLSPRQPSDSGWVVDDNSWSSMTKPKKPTTDEREKCFQENLPDRVSFSIGLEAAFLAIYPNINQLFEEKNYPHLDMYVYRGVGTDNLKRIPQETLRSEVWDHSVTHEVAFLENVVIERIAQIRVHRPKHKYKVNVLPCENKNIALEPVGPWCDIEVLKQYRHDIYIETQSHFFKHS